MIGSLDLDRDACSACGRPCSGSHGVPMLDGALVTNKWLGKWFGAPACQDCYEAHRDGDWDKLRMPVLDHEGDPRNMIVDSTHALMPSRTFEELPDYSCSVPTGVIIGKRWKRRKHYYDQRRPVPPEGWVMGEYVESPLRPGYADVKWREIQVEEP